MTDEELPAEQIEIELDLPPGQEAEEDTLDRRTINTPSRQGAMIPVGWKPTVKKPIPVMRCAYVWPDDHARGGNRCNRWSLRGSRLCFTHGGKGNLKNVEEYRQAIIESARLQLIESAPSAVEVMLDLMANSPADNVRLKAAESVLDRTGIKTAAELNVNVEVNEATPAVALAERLGKLRAAADDLRRREAEAAAAAELAAQMAAATAVAELEAGDGDGEIIDGEVIED